MALQPADRIGVDRDDDRPGRGLDRPPEAEQPVQPHILLEALGDRQLRKHPDDRDEKDDESGALAHGLSPAGAHAGVRPRCSMPQPRRIIERKIEFD